MMKNLSCFFNAGLMVLSFFILCLIGLKFGYDIHRLNFALAMVFVVLLNPCELERQKNVILAISGGFFWVCTFFFEPKAVACFLFMVFLAQMFIYSKSRTDTNLGKAVIFASVFFNLSFITNTRIGDVQYEFASCYNYIEYILENNFMFWQENPLKTRPSYSSYHPILHFFMAGLGIRLGELLGFKREIANEGVQVIFVSYMFLYYIVAAKIFKLLDFKGICYIGCVSFVACFPLYYAIGGFFNNDALLLLFQALIVYYTLLYYKEEKVKYLYLVSVFVLLSGLTKLSGILVLGGLGAVGIDKLYKNRDRKTFKELLICFCLIVCGYSIWPIYQYFVLGVEFGFVPPQEHLSLKDYSLWERFSPLKTLFYDRMFYQDFGTNLWETMTKTALFGQWDFSYRGHKIMWLIESFVMLYKGLILIMWGGMLYLIVRKYRSFMTYFIIALFLGLLLGQVAFGLKHPYMCNQDFRYVAILALVMAILIGEFAKNIPVKLKNVLMSLVLMFSFSSCFIWWYISW